VIMTIELPKAEEKFESWWRTTGSFFFIRLQTICS